MEERKKQCVDNRVSSSVENSRIAIKIFGWFLFIVGIIVTIVGISDYSYNAITLIVGVSMVSVSIPLFIICPFLKGLATIVEASEYKMALIEREYDILPLERREVNYN
jgi:TctA family transporter